MKILLVDDDTIALEIMREALVSHGDYEIEAATDGLEAIQRVLYGDIDVVISDWMMPQMSGVDLCRYVREADLQHHVYFIMVTNRSETADLVEGFDAGADEFIPKPVAPAELNARVRSIERLKALNDRIAGHNENLERVHRMKNDWINMVVHDLRTPMTSILGFSDLAMRDDMPPEQLQRFVGSVRREALRVSAMLEQMMVMSKSEDGRLELSRKKENLAALVREAADTASPGMQARDVRIRMEVGPTLADVPIDSALFRRVIDNLLENARRFAPRDSEIQIELREDEDEVILAVADQGPGVPDQYRSCIFGQHFTAHQETGKSQFGFGLTYCRTVVEAHGGRISCEPNEPHGARFEIRLPGPRSSKVLKFAPDSGRSQAVPRIGARSDRMTAVGTAILG